MTVSSYCFLVISTATEKLRRLTGVISLILPLVAISACGGHGRSDTGTTPVLSGPPNAAYPMPPLNAASDAGWTLADGERAKVSDYRDKVLVLDFYATWCAPCRESIPRLISLERQYGEAGLEIVGLNVGGPDDRVKVSAFAKELNIQYPLGFPDKALTDLFLSDNQTIPQTFVVAREGRLMKRFIGYDQATETELEKLIGEEVKAKISQQDKQSETK